MKKQMKKGLSLIMAVLMVMSCWVWVAPTKAEAAASVYYVKVYWAADNTDYSQEPKFDENDDKSSAGFKFEYKENNGTVEGFKDSKGDLNRFIDCRYGKENRVDNYSVLELPGFPTKIHMEQDGGTSRGNGSLFCKGIWVGSSKDDDSSYVQIFNGTVELESTSKCKSCTISIDGTFYTNDPSNVKLTQASTAKWELPVPTSSSFTDNPVNVTIPAVGSGLTNTTAIQRPVIKDQYGVEWYDTPDFNFAAAKGATEDISADVDYLKLTTSGEGIGAGATVGVTEDFQVQSPLRNNDNLYKDYYLVAQVTGNNKTHIASQKIRFNYPTYKYQFMADTDTTITYKDNTTHVGNITDDANLVKAYGQTLTNYPVSAAKTGHEFLGFFTVPQPTTGNASANTLRAQFQSPVSSAEYQKLTDDMKANYYDAGTKWDPTTNADLLTCTGNSTYYAWFVAKDVSVKFFSITGAYIKEVTTKYGKMGNEIVFPTVNEDFPDSYESGPFKYSNFTGKWIDSNGDRIDENTVFNKDAYILTPEYNSVTYDNAYNVTFFNGNGSNTIPNFSKSYQYREDIAAPNGSNAVTIASTAQYDFEWIGWTTVEPTGTDKRHILKEDSDTTLDGNMSVAITNDFIVRRDVNYYPVYRAKTRSYDVSFIYMGSDVEFKTVTKKFKYGEAIVVPDGVPNVYATKGKEYKLLGWARENQSNPTVTMAYERCDSTVSRYIAKYDTGTFKPYTITFVGKDENNADKTVSVEVNHGDKVPAETVDALKSATEYDDGTNLLTFMSLWSYNGKDYTLAELKEFAPESHVTFEAVYGNAKPFHKVTYIDGSHNATYRVAEGKLIPEWTVTTTDAEGNETTEPYVPSKDNTEAGKYVFIGWGTEQQTEDQIAKGEIAGTKYEANKSTITADTRLYAQFQFTEFTYTIKFVNYDDTVLAENANLHFGDSLENLLAEAVGKATKPSDNTYYYQFIGWDKKVPEICEGGEDGSVTTYKAQYRERYNYYNVYWYNTDADGNPVNPDGTSAAEGEAVKAIGKGSYIYNDKIHTTSESFTAPAGDKDTTYVLKSWKYQDKNDEWKTFSRNLRIDDTIIAELGGDLGKGVKMYAVYGEATKQFTVTVKPDANDSTKDYEITVSANDTIANLVSDPADGYIDKDTHNEFIGWYTGEGEGTAFNVETPIASDITIWAKFSESVHNRNLSEVEEAPTYPMASYIDYDGTVVAKDEGKGKRANWCACNKEGTKTYADILPLTDNIAPTATTYVGTTNWSTLESAYIADTVYASPNTDLIITTGDKGDVNTEFNPDGTGIGVQKIKLAIIDTATTDIATTDIADSTAIITAIIDGDINLNTVYDWTEIQNSLIANYGGWAKVPERYKNYNANYSAKLDDYDLTNGKTYIAVYVITDKADNSSYAMTGKFYYDDVAPVITVTGKANANKDTYCGQATLIVSETCTVTDNGIELTKQTDDKYYVATAGQHRIVATDASGNKTTIYFNVNADHEYANYTQNPTCTEAGYTSQKCVNCGVETDKTPIDKLGHKEDDRSIAATCTENGKKIIVCSRCGETLVNQEFILNTEGNVTNMPVEPELGHDYDEGTVLKAATCSSYGTLSKSCKRCGYTITETISMVENAHSFGVEYVIKASCTEVGYRKHRCRYCQKIETIAEIPATGHTKDDKYTVVKEATCTEKGLEVIMCTVCGQRYKDSQDNEITNEIPLKEHFWVLDEDKCKDPSPTEQGYVALKCKNCGATNGYNTDMLNEFTVTFMPETGDTAIAALTQAEGTSIDETTVTNPTKDSTEQYSYTFLGWYTKDAKGNYDVKYTLPMQVTKDLTLYARFKEEPIVKTLVFQVPDSYNNETGEFSETATTVKKLIGTVGDTGRIPAEIPVFTNTAYNTFTFDYWQTSNGAEFDGTITDNGTYTAVFKVETNKYNVIFMNGTQTAHKTFAVNAGDNVTAVEIAAITTPTKESDKNSHYTFCGWYTQPGCSSEDTAKKVTAITDVTEKTVVYAGYDEAAHTKYSERTAQEASCTVNELTEYTCTCDYKWTEVTKYATGHEPNDPVFNEETGKNDFYCKNCGEYLKSEDASYLIKFVDYNNSPIVANVMIERGETFYSQAKDAETKAAQPADNLNIYKFKGWSLVGDTSGTIYTSDNLPAATANATYQAVYTAEPRLYSVTFAKADGTPVKTYTGVKAGTTISENNEDYSKFTYNATDFPAPASDSKNHYVFDRWDHDITVGATDDELIRPIYKGIKHTFDKGVKTGATCTEPGGTKYTCTDGCGYSYVDNYNGKEPVLGHDETYAVINAPTYDTKGLGRYTCQRCGETRDEEIPCKERLIITVTVKDTNGKVYVGAKVTITHKDNGRSYGPQLTDNNGVATFYVDDAGTYVVSIVEIPGHEGGSYGEITIGEDGKITNNTVADLKGEDHKDCSCGCHRNGFWGSIFRFFHKIIKLFAGRYICCDCPDSRY